MLMMLPDLSFPGISEGSAGCHIDFDALVDTYLLG